LTDRQIVPWCAALTAVLPSRRREPVGLESVHDGRVRVEDRPFTAMTALLEKLKSLRRRRPTRTKKKPAADHHAGHRRILLWTALISVLLVSGFFWFTSARILGEPVRISYGPQDAVFPDSLGPLLGAEFSGGNSIHPLVNGDQIFPAMLEAIRGARRSITLETYIWSSGKISDQFIEALGERARHGVKVHVLADGMGTLKFHDRDRDRLRSAGVEFLVYGREHWYEIKANINHRTHRKILVVDGRIGFTGGMCIDDHWLGNADSPKVWRETAVRIEGPAVRQMQAVFATNWLQTTSRLLVGPEYFPSVGGNGTSLAQCFKSGPNEDPENARVSYLLAIAAARQSLRISHAYFVPDDLATEMLLEARGRGVRVQVIVPKINDSRFGRAASRSRWGPLLDAGVEFYEYEPAMFHCKVMVVDDVFVTLGSVNFDNRSFAINDEMNVNILDPVSAREYLRIFDDDLRHSHRLTPQEFASRPLAIKLLDRFCGLFRSQL
jgi:cardiolipin synthase